MFNYPFVHVGPTRLLAQRHVKHFRRETGLRLVPMYNLLVVSASGCYPVTGDPVFLTTRPSTCKSRAQRYGSERSQLFVWSLLLYLPGRSDTQFEPVLTESASPSHEKGVRTRHLRFRCSTVESWYKLVCTCHISTCSSGTHRCSKTESSAFLVLTGFLHKPGVV